MALLHTAQLALCMVIGKASRGGTRGEKEMGGGWCGVAEGAVDQQSFMHSHGLQHAFLLHMLLQRMAFQIISGCQIHCDRAVVCLTS